MKRIPLHRAAGILALLALAVVSRTQPVARERVGPLPDHAFLLNSGWRVKPAGIQIPLDTFPMSAALSHDGKFLIVLNGGYRPPSLSVIDVKARRELSRTPVPDGWLGLAFAPDGTHLYVGGGSQASVFEFTLDGEGALRPARTIELIAGGSRAWQDFAGDVAVSPDGKLLYVTMLYRDAIYVVDAASGKVLDRFGTGRRPYRILVHPDGQSLYVSSWANGSVYHHLAKDGSLLQTMRLGAHTSDMVWSTHKPAAGGENIDWQARLFVAASNTNYVYSVAISPSGEMRRLETINVAMTPHQPAGMTPSALALNADESRLYVVCSDVNAVAAVDISEAQSAVLGFVPVGWYPTAARVTPAGDLFVLNGRGAASYPNPGGPNPARRPEPVHAGTKAVEYVAHIQTGSASVIAAPTDDELHADTGEVLRNSPYSDDRLEQLPIPEGNPIPAVAGGPTPIQHVIYIVKENRTYDQVLGDLGKGESDPALVLFGEKVSPNHHKLAREFVLFDNFYVNSDVSADGHNWSTAAIAPDYVQKLWPNSYAHRRKHYDYEETDPASLPPAGYLWTNAAARGISMRNYGYMADELKSPAPDGTQVASVRDPVLRKVTNMRYRGFDLAYRDVDRARVFLDDLKQFETAGEMPRLIFMRLGNDHTSGTAAGKIAPLSSFADNDYALGQIVDGVSHRSFWKSTAIFVLEDDAQNGPDHVDSHRSMVFVLSPWTHRGIIDSTMYNTTSVLRTMEQILGLRPMTTFDAGARTMFAAFSPQAAPVPYTVEQPRIPLDERNPTNAAGAQASARMDFSDADLIDDDELNAILWRAIRKTEPPAPVRSFFAR